jgi:hypothetical protein
MARRPAVTNVLAIAVVMGMAQKTFGLQVTPGSPCSGLCLGDPNGDVFSPEPSQTNSSDIVCNDSEYADSDAGKNYQKCAQCLAESHKWNGTESDLGWLICKYRVSLASWMGLSGSDSLPKDNSRFSVTSCLFDFPADIPNAAIETSCLSDDRCGSLKQSLVDDGLDTATKDPYQYCTADNSSFVGRGLRPCMECLRSSPQQAYMANCEFSVYTISLQSTS